MLTLVHGSSLNVLHKSNGPVASLDLLNELTPHSLFSFKWIPDFKTKSDSMVCR